MTTSPGPFVSAVRAVRGIYRRKSSDLIVTRHVDLRRHGSRLGIRIVLASDIHAREDWFPRASIADTVRAINAVEGADLVALVGDFVANDETAIDWAAEEFTLIDAPTAAVLGNHDHWTDAAHIEAALESAGIYMLTNSAIPFSEISLHSSATADGAELWLAGIDSCWPGKSKRRADPDAAFENVPHTAEAVVLGHEPFLATMHEHALHLAGHTHCGQVRTPIFGDLTAKIHMPRYSEPYACGLHEVPVTQPTPRTSDARHRTSGDRRWVYTTAGVGYSTVSMRVFCPPEIVVIDA